MNLSPQWIPTLANYGWRAIHWSSVGNPRASDREIMNWAASRQYVVFTHDLDFSAMLALTHASGPSVLQVRTQNTLPAYLEDIVVTVLTQYEDSLIAGALAVVDEGRSRVRLLPI